MSAKAGTASCSRSAWRCSGARPLPAFQCRTTAQSDAPDTSAIPVHELEARTAEFGEHVSRAVTGRAPPHLLHVQRQAVDASAHVHRRHQVGYWVRCITKPQAASALLPVRVASSSIIVEAAICPAQRARLEVDFAERCACKLSSV